MWCMPVDFLGAKCGGVTPTWSRVIYNNKEKNNPGPLAHHTACLWNMDNSAYFVGGLKPDGTSNTELFRFDVNKGIWH